MTSHILSVASTPVRHQTGPTVHYRLAAVTLVSSNTKSANRAQSLSESSESDFNHCGIQELLISPRHYKYYWTLLLIAVQ